MKLLKSIKGMSLVEVIVALGVMGGISVGMMQIQKNMVTSQKRNETVVNSVSLVDRISLNLLSSEACTNTFQSANANSGLIVDGSELTEIRNKGPAGSNVVFEVGQKYFNNTIEIQKMVVNVVNPFVADATGVQNGDVELEVSYTKPSAILADQDANGVQKVYIKRTTPVRVKLNPDNTIASCHSAVEDAVETARRQSCMDLGGLFNQAEDRCDLQPDIANVKNATNVQFTEDTYVNTTGDTITGDLNVQNSRFNLNDAANVPAITLDSNGIALAEGKKICIGSGANERCVQVRSCDPGLIQLGLSSSGEPICSNQKCAENEFMYGYEIVSGAAQPKCKLIVDKRCDDNQYVASVEKDGTVNCLTIPPKAAGSCSDGFLLEGYTEKGDKICKPYSDTIANKKCADGQIMEGFNEFGIPVCKTPPPDQSQTVTVSREFAHSGNNDGYSTIATDSEYDMCFITGFIKNSLQRGQNTDFGCDIRKMGKNWQLGIPISTRINNVTCKAKCISICAAPIQGRWDVKDIGYSCSCPRGSTNGTKQMAVSCEGAKCGGTCDSTAKPSTTQSCFCPQSCKSGHVSCKSYGNNCVPREQCPDDEVIQVNEG